MNRDSNTILNAVKEALSNAEIDCALLQPSDPILFPRLLIYAGNDTQRREHLIEVTSQPIEMAQSLSLSLSQQHHEYSRIQIDASYPFIVNDLATSEVAQFLHFLNLQIEVPGFYLNHLDNIILYRHVLLCDNNHLPIKIILSLIGIAMFFQDAFSPTLERISNGKITFAELLEEIQQVLAKITPKNP
jgi:hypothetical protein